MKNRRFRRFHKITWVLPGFGWSIIFESSWDRTADMLPSVSADCQTDCQIVST